MSDGIVLGSKIVVDLPKGGSYSKAFRRQWEGRTGVIGEVAVVDGETWYWIKTEGRDTLVEPQYTWVRDTQVRSACLTS